MKIKQENDERIVGMRDNNNNITVKQEDDDDGDLSSRNSTLKWKEESLQKQHNYYESSYTEASAINYMIVHIEENRPFGCDLCEKRYKRAWDLKCHVRSHSGERLYSCIYCQKAFYRSTDRNDHERIHRGDRQYECQKCDAKFVVKGNLTEHYVSLHPVSTDIVCTYPNCEKKYSRQFLLNRHIKRDHWVGVKKYKCLSCSVSFPVPAKLRIHLMTKKHLRLSQQQQEQPNSESISPEEQKGSIRKSFKCRTCTNVYKSRERLMRHEERRGHWPEKSSNNNVMIEDHIMHQKEESHVPDENFCLSTLQIKIKKEKVEKDYNAGTKPI